MSLTSTTSGYGSIAMTERRDRDDIDWSLTTWEGSRRAQLERWASMSLDRILEAQEEMAELSRDLARQASEIGTRATSPAVGTRVAERRAAYGVAVHDLALTGCTPEPLMSYLKALGVLRLVSEQKDEAARGCWKNDVFWLRSPVLFEGAATEESKRVALARFLLEEYKPTPIVAPWGARSGFFPTTSEKSAREALDAILTTASPQLEPFQWAISSVRQLLAEMKLDAKAKDDGKLKLLEMCRSRLPDDLLDWIDACYVLTSEDRKFPPLLGTGGNEGSGSYVSGFAEQVVGCLIKRRESHALTTALFGIPAAGVASDQTPGHFSPTAAGGPNAGQGFDGPTRTNAWDYLLCLEGTCAWACATVRRLGRQGRSMAAFPFTVNPTGAGDSGIALADQFKPRQAKRPVAEMWLPLWSRPISFSELRSLISEGRATVGGRDVENGVDFARATAMLGVDRGIESFQRTIFLMRNGQSFLNVSLGRFEVCERRSVDLLREIDHWLAQFASTAAEEKTPPRFKAVAGRLNQAIFNLCRYGGRMHLQSVLIALGQAERELAVTQGKVGQTKRTVPPLAGLSAQWIAYLDDGSPEFAIARALAAVRDDERNVGPVRTNLEAVVFSRRKTGEWSTSWVEKDRAVVWNASDLYANLANVLQRRVIDGARAGCEHLPLGSRFEAPLDAVSAFLAGELDEHRIEDLIWGLMLIREDGGQRVAAGGADQSPLPRAYALMKLLYLPRPLVVERRADGRLFGRLLRQGEGGGVVIRPEQSIPYLVRGGMVGEACAIAMRRLRASGLNPMPRPIRGRRVRDRDWQELDRIGGSAMNARRLAAALLIPIGDGAISTLVRLVIDRDNSQDPIETSSAVNLEGDTAS